MSLIILAALGVVLIALLLSNKLPVDLSSLTVLTILTLLGYVTPEESIAGFSSPAVFSMVATFFITGALRRTGITAAIGDWLYTKAGKSEVRNIALVIFVSSFVSSFMNNLAAAALLLPAVVGLAKKSHVSPSKLMMPLAFGVLLGGMNTLIGTTPNLVAVSMLRERGIAPFHFFQFTPFGVILTVISVAFFILIGRKALPSRDLKDTETAGADHAELYRLKERLFLLRVPSDFPLKGRTLKDLHFGHDLGLVIDAIIRGEARIEAPSGNELVQAGDTLLVQGRLGEFEAIKRLQGCRVASAGNFAIDESSVSIVLGVAQVKDEALKGRSPYQLGLREDYDVVVCGLQRGDEYIFDDLSQVKMLVGDKLLLAGTASNLSRLKISGLGDIKDVSSVRTSMPQRLHLLTLPNDTDLSGVLLKDSELGRLGGIQVLAIARGREFILSGLKEVCLKAGDRFLVISDRDHLERMIHLSRLEVVSDSAEFEISTEGLITSEVLLSPRSWLIGRTLEDVRFRDKFRTSVLAIWRRGEPMRARLSRVPLAFGDTLLVVGDERSISIMRRDTNFVFLSTPGAQVSVRRSKAPFAVASLMSLVILSAFGILPVEIAALVGALIATISRAITMEEGYKEIDWRIITLVGAMIPIGAAVENSGALTALVNWLGESSLFNHSLVALITLVLLASLVSQLLDNTIAVILLIPVALQSAQHFGAHPHQYALAVTLGASLVFMTPVSHRANLLVMGPGGYKLGHFLKIGTPLTVLSVATIVGLLVWMF